ncbi:MAG: DUF2461 domain-containing protein [bacterium]|nr:DUF2461 domain-containing protein [bacterium]
MKMNNFTGFSKETFRFLKEIESNNNKAWFEKNETLYREHLVQPFRDLVTDLGDTMLTIDPELITVPSINKTISGIHRDTRFSKDKSPYKNTMWITFKRRTPDWRDTPVYFFEIAANSYRFGMGFYYAKKKTMDRFRELIITKEKEFLAVTSFLSQQDLFSIEGEKYSKIINPEISGPTLDWYQRKNLYLVCNKKIDNCLFGHELVTVLIDNFLKIAPLYHFLWKTGV